MRRRTITAALVLGFVLSVAAVYPIVGLFAPLLLPGWHPPLPNLFHGLLLMASAVVGVPILLFGGMAAVRYADAAGLKDGLRMGLLAGATIGMAIYLTIILPINALAAYGVITPRIPHLLAANPLPPASLLEYVTMFDRTSYSAELTIGFMVLFWGLQGAMMGWRRRFVPRPRRGTLLSVLVEGQNPREWARQDESVLRVSMFVGVAIGALVMISTFGWFYYTGFNQSLPDFETLLQNSSAGMITSSLPDALRVLSPVLSVVMLTYGFVIVGLARQPRNRVRQRVMGVTFAGVIIFAFFCAVALRIFYFNVGLTPFLLSDMLLRDSTEIDSFFEQIRPVMDSFTVPQLLIWVTLASAWAAVAVAVGLGMLWGGLQGLVSALIMPMFVKRPVDRAADVYNHLKRDPNGLLPLLYTLCSTGKEASDTLAHLTLITHRPLPDVAMVAAAHHTLATSRDRGEQVQAAGVIEDVLSAHPQWRWSAEFGTVYGTLYDVLMAGSFDQILRVPPPSTQETGSLPPLMARSLQHLTRIITELQKSQKVDDLRTQLIFLENGLAAIHDAQRFVATEMGSDGDSAVGLPQRNALLAALDHWQGVVLNAIQRQKGRADISSTLQSQLCAFCNPMPLMWEVANNGLNVAQEVRLRVLPGAGYVVDEGETEIEILPPGESRELVLTIVPQTDARRLRVEWEVVYDDAVVDDRQVTFADMVEFAEPERPFERVFPIPYVTGTPLKTDDVFVGRDDVFAFIYENLLGAHQNNVIILHGQRRTGKTSVLYRLGQVMADTHYGVLIDMQGKPARSEADFLYSIADDIAFALEDEGLMVPLPERSEFVDAPEFTFRNRFLRGLTSQLNGKQLLLMFDEFEELQHRVESGRLQPEIFPFLRNLMQHEEKVDFVFSGTHRLEDLSATYWSVLFNIAAYKPITFLSADDVRRLMTEPIAQYEIEFDPLAVERISKVTAGHPYFAQLILHELMVYHNETARTYLTVTDVNQAVERILERGEAHFKYIWSESTDDERELLLASAELLHGSKRGVTLAELQAHLAAQGYGSDDEWQAALGSLVGRDILTLSGAKRQLVGFKVDLIRLWIERTRPRL